MVRYFLLVSTCTLSEKIIIDKSSPETNPYNYLFPTYYGTQKGKPISRDNVVNNLNKLARENNIVDEDGDIYRYIPHSFRHRFGINLINNGINILHV